MPATQPITAILDAPGRASGALYLEGPFNLSLWGEFSGEATVQRSFDGGQNWLDVQSFAAPAEALGLEPEGALYRVAVKNTASFAGVANVRIGR